MTLTVRLIMTLGIGTHPGFALLQFIGTNISSLGFEEGDDHIATL